MYLYVCICVYTYVRACGINVCNVHIWSVCIYTSIYIYKSICVHTFVCVYMCVYVCVYVCVCVCVCVYIHQEIPAIRVF